MDRPEIFVFWYSKKNKNCLASSHTFYSNICFTFANNLHLFGMYDIKLSF